MRRGIPLWGFSARIWRLTEARWASSFFRSCWRKREAVSFAASVIWFFENWLNIARYMADARAQVLPLVGGGDHDWATIFGRWRVLGYDTRIAGVVNAAGWAGMFAACLWVIWRWWRSRGASSEDEEWAF